METIIVLGGSGYIGSHVILHLQRNGYKVVNVDLKPWPHEHLENLDSFQLDVRNEDQLLFLYQLYSPIATIHLCAYIYVGESMEKPIEYYDNNINTTLSALRCMKATDCPQIIFSSTAAVYGTPSTTPITEDMSTNPINPYGASKLAAEDAIRWSGVRYVIFRYFNACGCNEVFQFDNPCTHLIPIIHNNLKKSAPIQIFGDDYPTLDGTCVRDYIHVDDLANAHIQAIGYPSSDIFNLGRNKGISVCRIIEKFQNLLPDKSIPTQVTSRRSGDPPALVADARKANRLLNWTPTHGTYAMITSTMAGFK